jgi:hypothetical protein
LFLLEAWTRLGVREDGPFPPVDTLLLRDRRVSFAEVTAENSDGPPGFGVRYLTYTQTNYFTTLSNGCLGSGNDEERSEMRYVMRIAELSESSNLRTQNALSGQP